MAMVEGGETGDSGYICLTVGWGGGGRCQSVAMVEGGETGDSGYICLTVGGGGGGGGQSVAMVEGVETGDSICGSQGQKPTIRDGGRS